MKYPGHFDDNGHPVTHRQPQSGRVKRLDADRIEAIAQFVEDRERGSRIEVVTIYPPVLTVR